MALTVDIVQAQFERAKAFSDQATTNAQELIEQLGTMASGISPPAFTDATVQPTLPSQPQITLGSTLLPVVFNDAATPPDYETAPVIDTSLDAPPSAPDLITPELASLNLPAVPDAPIVNLDYAPVDAPSIADEARPTLVAINVPAPIVVSLPDPPQYIDATERLTPPAPYSYVAGPEYASQLLAALQDTLKDRLNASTGLAPDVEQALWDRARSRELATTLGNQTEITRTIEATGFALPPGVLAEQMRESQRDYFGKVSELSRDIAIKQADLEQSNARAAIEQGIALESRLIEYANQIEQRAFDAARILAENAVAIYNARIAELRQLIDAFVANANIFKARADVEISKVEVYRAQVQAESLKTEINKSAVEVFRALIDASKTKIELYRAQVEAQKTLVEIEQAKVGVFGERVRAYQAQVQAELAKLEIPKTQVAINDSQAQVYRARVEAFATVAGTRNANAKNQVDIYDAKIRALTSRWQGYSARVGAEAERVKALTGINSNLLERDRTVIQRDIAFFQQTTGLFSAQVGLYEAQTRTNIERNKLASEQYFTARQAVVEAAKVGAQVNAQLAASGFSTAHVNASQQVDFGVRYNYSGSTNSSSDPG